MMGMYWGCDMMNCGTCVVLFDGKFVKFCIVFVVMVDGHVVCMVEGFEVGGEFDFI